MSQNEMPYVPLPTVERSSILYELPFLSIQSDLLRLPEGGEHTHYTLLIGEAAVMVLVTTAEGDLVINREYRPSTQKVLWSCPGGVLDQGEDPIAGATRELREETGYAADGLRLVGLSYPAPGICSQVIYFVVGYNAKPVAPPDREEEEFIETHQISVTELQERILAGEPVDGNLCAALFWRSLDTSV